MGAARILMTKPQKSHCITVTVSVNQNSILGPAQVQGVGETTQRHEYWEVWFIGGCGGGWGSLWKLAPFLLANFLYVIGQNCVTAPFLNQSLLGKMGLVRGAITPQDGSR